MCAPMHYVFDTCNHSFLHAQNSRHFGQANHFPIAISAHFLSLESFLQRSGGGEDERVSEREGRGHREGVWSMDGGRWGCNSESGVCVGAGSRWLWYCSSESGVCVGAGSRWLWCCVTCCEQPTERKCNVSSSPPSEYG